MDLWKKSDEFMRRKKAMILWEGKKCDFMRRKNICQGEYKYIYYEKKKERFLSEVKNAKFYQKGKTNDFMRGEK